MTSAQSIAPAIGPIGKDQIIKPVHEWLLPWMAPASGNVAILLENGIFQEDPNRGAHIQLDFPLKENGEWAAPVWALGKNYGICYNAWDSAFRDRVTAWLRAESPKWSFNRQNNPTAHSNHHAGGSGEQGVLAMSVLAEPGPQPRKMASVTPPTTPAAGKGVPVVKLQSGVSITDWIAAGPFAMDAAVDRLAAIGVRAGARPELGTSVTHGKVTRTFAPVTANLVAPHRKYTRGHKAVDIMAIADGTPDSTAYCYTVLDVTEAGNYQVRFIADGTDVWFGPGSLDCVLYLNGTAFGPKDIAQLKPGRYPAMLECHITDKQKQINMVPHLVALGDDVAAKEVSRSQQAFAMRQSKDPINLDDYLAAAWDGPAVRGRMHAQRGVRRWLMAGVGETGVCTEKITYRLSTLRAIYPFLHAYDVAMGKRYVDGFSSDWLLSMQAASRVPRPQHFCCRLLCPDKHNPTVTRTVTWQSRISYS